MKANKKGISLIVLVITIIVIIILAAAVILTLNGNNPMNNSKIATASQNKDSLESAISLYISQAVIKTNGDYSTSDIIKGNGDATLAIVKNNTAITSGAITDLYELGDPASTAGQFKKNVEIDVPANIGTGKWCISASSAKVYIVFDTMNDVPSYMKDGSNLVSNVTSFVLIKGAAA